jgi:hypothetical protein
MFVIDECGSVPDPVAKTAEAVLANAEPGTGREAKLFLFGNPDIPEGPLYRAFEIEPHMWWRFEISADPEDPNRAPRVSIQWAREMIERWGRDDPWVMANVLGLFPPGGAHKWIDRSLVQKAAQQNYRLDAYGWAPKILGVDIARFGDDRSVIAARQGLVAFKPMVFRGEDTMEMAGHIAAAIKRWHPDQVFIDVTGGLGAGPYDRLVQLGHLNVTAVEFASKSNSGRYHKKRDEIWGLLKEWLDEGGAIPNDHEMISDLCAPNRAYTPAAKMVLESKESMKERGVPSPDIGDALALTFAFPVAVKGGERHKPERPRVEIEAYDPFAILDEPLRPTRERYDPLNPFGG